MGILIVFPHTSTTEIVFSDVRWLNQRRHALLRWLLQLTVQMNEAQTSVSHAVGVCSEVGTFAGGFFVRPNKINFRESLKMFLTPWENPIGLILVTVIFLLFFILLYWAIRKDKQDALLASISAGITQSQSQWGICIAPLTELDSGAEQ